MESQVILQYSVVDSDVTQRCYFKDKTKTVIYRFFIYKVNDIVAIMIVCNFWHIDILDSFCCDITR